jgi:hypothetical protein
VGSDAHGFDFPFPRSLMTGTPEDVAAIAMSTVEGGRPSLLQGSQQTLTCAKPTLAGRKRWVINPEVFASWKFSAVSDLAQYTDQELATVPDGADFKDLLTVVRAPSGALFVLDGGRKREVDPAVLRAWRIDPAVAEQRSAAQLDAIATGDVIRARPELAIGDGPKVFLIEPPSPPTGAAGGNSRGGNDGPGAGSAQDERVLSDAESSDSGCGVAGRGSPPSGAIGGLLFLMLLLCRTASLRLGHSCGSTNASMRLSSHQHKSRGTHRNCYSGPNRVSQG